MDQARKRQIRLVVALATAVLLAVALFYVSLSASAGVREPSDLLIEAPSGGTYDLTGRVAEGTVEEGRPLRFEVEDVEGGEVTVPVVYEGIVPDPFREGREVIVTGALDGDGTFVAEKDSLITKCPSKFKEDYGDDPNVIIDPSLD